MRAQRSHGCRWPAIVAGMILLFGSTSAFAQSPSERRGAIFVRAHCAQCHAVDKTSESPRANAPSLRMLRLKYHVADLQRPLLTGIHPAMPLFRLHPHQVEDVMVYLRTLER